MTDEAETRSFSILPSYLTMPAKEKKTTAVILRVASWPAVQNRLAPMTRHQCGGRAWHDSRGGPISLVALAHMRRHRPISARVGQFCCHCPHFPSSTQAIFISSTYQTPAPRSLSPVSDHLSHPVPGFDYGNSAVPTVMCCSRHARARCGGKRTHSLSPVREC